MPKIPEQYECSICAKRQMYEGGTVHTSGWMGAAFDPISNRLEMRPWTEWTHMDDATHHLCSPGCALVMTDRYLSGEMLHQYMTGEPTRKGVKAA